MLRLNKPLEALKAGELGDMCKVFALARRVARDEKKARGNVEKERQDQGAKAVAYKEQEEPKPCLTERAVKAAATRQSNQDTAIAWSRDVEGHLLWSDDAIMATTDAQLGRHLQAWKRAVATTFSNGCYWPGAWPGGFPKGTGTKLSLKKEEKQMALLAVIKNHHEMKARALQ